MRCYTQEAIAGDLQIGIATVNSIISREFENCQTAKSEEMFKPELYTIWNFAKLGKDHDYPGNLPPAILELAIDRETRGAL